MFRNSFSSLPDYVADFRAWLREVQLELLETLELEVLVSRRKEDESGSGAMTMTTKAILEDPTMLRDRISFTLVC